MRLQSTLLFVVACLATGPVGAEYACHATSGPLARPLVELYTSEGCDSCPPAERWLSSRFGPGDTRQAAIALAFHVDYWDRLGWIDRFAKAQYTARQYDAMRANGASFVYTPQILLQGHDYGAWRSGDARAIDAASRANAGATIAVDVTPGERNVAVHATAQVVDARSVDAQLFIAYADSGLVSDIKAGENRGLRLAHDHVVRSFREAGSAARDGRIDAALTLPKPAEPGIHPMLVAFVERASSGDVLQALAVPLDDCVSR